MHSSPYTPAGAEAHLPSDFPVTLVVVVDTEEEFDWYGEFSRDATDVQAIEHLWRFTEITSATGIRPTYVLDYPMASHPQSVEVLRKIHESGEGELGIQLHGWVTPPFEEELSRRNSYQMNLPPALEQHKLETLVETFTRAFDTSPRVHKAGRYGFGPHTAEALAKLGVLVDMSFAPGYDFSGEGGPDYSRASACLQWLGPRRNLLEIPTAGGFVGPWASLGPSLHAARYQRNPLMRLGSHTLSRLHLSERIMLSPEGHSLPKLERLTRTLLARGHRVLTFSLHSPSLKPGGTSYVRTDRELDEFLANCRRFFDFFFGEVGGRSMTALEVHSALEHR